jgi:cell division protein FtsL
MIANLLHLRLIMFLFALDVEILMLMLFMITLLIKQQNDHIAKLDAKIAEHDLENENFKFARSMLYSGRRPGIKDGIGFKQGDNVKLNAPP